QNGLIEGVLNCDMRTACTLNFSILVICGKFVRRVGLNRNELPDAGIADSRSVKVDKQGTMSAVKIAGIEGKRDTGLPLILPIEAAIEHVKIEIAIDD